MTDLYDLILSISVAVTYSKLVRRVFFFRSLKAKKGMESSYCNNSTAVFTGEAWGELCVSGSLHTAAEPAVHAAVKN